MQYSYILFDLDGTLVYSHKGIYACFKYALEKMGRTPPKDEELRDCVGPPLEDSFRYKAENPQFPEAAIVMMADQIEAISRASKDYTAEGFKSIVDRVVDEKFKDER